MSPPIYGVYNDYGGIEQYEPMPWYEEALEKMLASEYHQLKFANERASFLTDGRLPTCFKEFLEYAERRDYLITGRPENPVVLALAHRSIFEQAVKCLKYRDSWYNATEVTAVKLRDLGNNRRFLCTEVMHVIMTHIIGEATGSFENIAAAINTCLDATRVSMTLRRSITSNIARGSQEDNANFYAHFLPTVAEFASDRVARDEGEGD
jgi:hypothetical protein